MTRAGFSTGPFLRQDPNLRDGVTDFMFHDAELLDTWRLEEWLELFTEDCWYFMPTTDRPNGDPHRDLFFIQDDRFLLMQRVTALMNGTAWAESPQSTTHRMISNVRACRLDDGTVEARANGIAHRASNQRVDVYPYRLELHLLDDGDSFKIHTRRAVLALDQLRPHGRVSILL